MTQRRLTPEEAGRMQAQFRQMRLESFPPQLDPDGGATQCVNCRGILHPLENNNYDGSVGGFCNKLCAKAYEKKLINTDNFSPQEASDEVDKYESLKPQKAEVKK